MIYSALTIFSLKRIQLCDTETPISNQGRFIHVITKCVYIKSTTVFVPSSELGLSKPLSRQRVFPSPKKRWGGGTLACGEGLGEYQFRRLEKKLSTLPTLCM